MFFLPFCHQTPLSDAFDKVNPACYDNKTVSGINIIEMEMSFFLL